MESEEPKPKKRRGKKPGTPKTGGRQKGTRNRNSLSVLGALDQANIPLIDFLIRDIQTLEPAHRINEWHRLLSFCYPRLKDIDFSPPLPANTQPSLPPASQPTKDERFHLIRGHFAGKPEASG